MFLQHQIHKFRLQEQEYFYSLGKEKARQRKNYKKLKKVKLLKKTENNIFILKYPYKNIFLIFSEDNMNLNNKNLIIIIASLFCFIACATGIIVYNINSNNDFDQKIVNLQKELKYAYKDPNFYDSNKYSNLKFDDPKYAFNEEQHAINILSKEFDLFIGCRNVMILGDIPTKDPKKLEFHEKSKLAIKNLANKKCIPTYKVVKKYFPNHRIFQDFIKAMEFYVPNIND